MAPRYKVIRAAKKDSQEFKPFDQDELMRIMLAHGLFYFMGTPNLPKDVRILKGKYGKAIIKSRKLSRTAAIFMFRYPGA